jgi:hypothetical protein
LANEPESYVEELERREPERVRQHQEYLAKVAAWEAKHPRRFRRIGASDVVYTGDPILDESNKVRLEMAG